MGKFILHVSGGCYTFTFHADSGDNIAVSPPFITKSSAQQALSETRVASRKAHQFKKCEREGRYYFELHGERDQLLLVSGKYWSADSRDYGILAVTRWAADAPLIETV